MFVPVAPKCVNCSIFLVKHHRRTNFGHMSDELKSDSLGADLLLAIGQFFWEQAASDSCRVPDRLR